MSEETPDRERKGLHAGHLIILMAMVMLGLGVAFFVIASREPVELVRPDGAKGAESEMGDGSRGPAEPPRLESP